MELLGSVPSGEHPDGFSVLEGYLPKAESITAAVAFVSLGGVGLLAPLLERNPEVKVTLVARGAPITDPDALVQLEDLGASVSVLAGTAATAFHPKLWLLRRASQLCVFSGSGNLTAGGLRTNQEQFEIMRFTDAVQIEAQEKRLARLTDGAIPLHRFRGSLAWRLWRAQQDARVHLLEKEHAMNQALAESNPINRRPDVEQLQRDMWDVYDRTLAARLKKKNGHIYNPSGLRLQLEGKRGPKEPVPIAASICKSGTEGFDTIHEANRPDLTIEFLVVDPTRPYHDLFPEETRTLSARRLRDQFPGFQAPWPD